MTRLLSILRTLVRRLPPRNLASWRMLLWPGVVEYAQHTGVDADLYVDWEDQELRLDINGAFVGLILSQRENKSLRGELLKRLAIDRIRALMLNKPELS